MLSEAIKNSVDLTDGASNQLGRKPLEGKVDQLLSGLIRSTKAKRTNRESRTVIADLFDTDKLKVLREVFCAKNRAERVDEDYCITAEDFKNALSDFIARRDVDLIYSLIDVSDLGVVSWQNVTDFLIAMESSNRHAEGHYTHQFIPRKTQDISMQTHKDMIETVCYCANPSPMIITGGRDGLLMMWSPLHLSRTTKILHKDKNVVFTEQLIANSKREQRAVIAKSRIDKVLVKSGAMITCLRAMRNSSHLVVGSADMAVTVYDLSNSEVCGRFVKLNAVPTAIEIVYRKKEKRRKFHLGVPLNDSTPEKQKTSTKGSQCGEQAVDFQKEEVARYIPTICVGDSNGWLHFIVLDEDFKSTVEAAQKHKNEHYLANAIKHARSIHTKGTNDTKAWIMAMTYLDELFVLATALMDGDIVLVDVEKVQLKQVFSGHGSSLVRELAWSSFGKYVCSVGERKVIVWDAFNVEIMVQLDGLTATALAVQVADRERKVFVAASDKSVRIWHNITFELLQVLVDTTVFTPQNVMSSFLYVPALGAMYSAGNLLTVWTSERQRSAGGNGREINLDDICTVLYNKAFKTVIVISQAGQVVIYNIDDGSDSNSFSIPDPNKAPASSPDKSKSRPSDVETGTTKIIAQACLDAMDKRLIVLTVCGRVQFWNFTCGMMLFEIKMTVPTSISYLTRGQKLFRITSVAHEVVTTEDGPKRFLILGSNCGFASCFFETKLIDDEPTFSLIRHGDMLSSLDRAKSAEHIRKEECSVLFALCVGGTKVAIAYSDGLATLWDLERASVVFEFDVQDSGIVLGCSQKSTTRAYKLHSKVKKVNELVKAKTMGILQKLMAQVETEEEEDFKQDTFEIENENSSEQSVTSSSNAQKSKCAAQISHEEAEIRPSRPSLFLSIKPSFRPRLTAVKQRCVEQQEQQIEKQDEPKPTTGQVNKQSEQEALESLRAQLEQHSIKCQNPVSLKATKRQLNVLLVDNSVVCLKMLHALLVRDDNRFIISVANSAASAAELLKVGEYDLVFVDFLMPGHVDTSAASVVHSLLKAPTQVIFTAAAPETRAEATRMGCSAFLMKPVTKESLRIALKSVFREVKGSLMVVESAVFLRSTNVMIGVCSDNLMRFWDVQTGKTLCSCRITQDEEHAAEAAATDVSASTSSALQTIKVSLNEATLVGGYNNGVIRVWELVHSSIDTLRSSLYQKLEEKFDNSDFAIKLLSADMRNRYVQVAANSRSMAVSPLNLIAEWRGHDAHILSLAYISLSDASSLGLNPNRFDLSEDPAAFEKEEYIMSAGMDQDVYLWNIWGKMVGVFGTDDWDVEQQHTFREQDSAFRDKIRRPTSLQPNPPECVKSASSSSSTFDGKPVRSLEDKATWRIFRDAARGVGSQALNAYTRNLTHKPTGRLLDEAISEYQSLNTKHPVEFKKADALEKSIRQNIPSLQRVNIAKKEKKTVYAVDHFAGLMLHHLHNHNPEHPPPSHTHTHTIKSIPKATGSENINTSTAIKLSAKLASEMTKLTLHLTANNHTRKEEKILSSLSLLP